MFCKPFNPTTTIRFSIPLDNENKGGSVSLKVFGIPGSEVATLLNNETMEEGTPEIQFNASKLTGVMHFYRLVVGRNDISSYRETKKMILLK